MIHVKCTKFEITTGILFLSTLMLYIPSVSQTSIFAQITPAPEKFGSSEDTGAADSSPDTGASNDNSQPITPSEGSDENTEEFTGSTDSNGVNSGQTTTTAQEDQTTNTEEQDSDPTNRLAEAIMNKVNNVLSASGIIIP